ncbi:hypothetical protein [Flavobacterium psychrotrophum]|uniref:hypothetical protein n=1 Tax=Flavobacterium psychrotrophum TaxID=2294119 RepID=UPI000E3151B2|nr:hypothetical protein [Flavobacterium psychrotrophum]
MKKQLTFLALLLFISVNAQFYKAEILLANGETRTGFSELPSNRLLDGSFNFKTDEKGRPESLKFKDVSKVTVSTDNGNTFMFDNLAIRQVIKSFGKVREKTSKNKSWMLVRYATPEIAYYYAGQSYIIDKDGNMITKTTDNGGTWASIALLLKRPGEEAATSISAMTNGATIIGEESLFRKTAAAYFTGETKFIERIEKKEFKAEDLLPLVKAYIDYKKN